MSRISMKGSAAGNLGEIVSSLKQRITAGGMTESGRELAGYVVGLESLSDANALSTVKRAASEIVAELKAVYDGAGVALEGISDAQFEAGAMVMLAAGDLAGYATVANKTAVSTEGVTLVDPSAFGNFDYRLKASVEAYDDRELRQYLPYSVAMNIEASRQSEFSETLYKTVVLSPDQAGLDITVHRTMVFNEIKHDITGRAMDFHRRNLIDAIVDASVLSSEATLVVPVYITGNAENVSQFAAGIAAYDREVDGSVVKTAPLAIGKTIDILGLSTTPNITGTQDSTDALDHRMHVEAVYVKFVAGTDTSYVKFGTMHFAGSQFQKSAEGLDRAMVLNFQTVDLPITAATEDVDGGAAAALAGLGANKTVRLALNLGGNANLQLGNVSVMGGAVTVDSVWDTTGGVWTEVTDAAAVAAVKAQFSEISVAGYDLYATRSNLNRRMLGIKGDVVPVTERHLIPMGAPITAHHPVTSNNELVTMASLTNIARVRNDINAVTQLLSYDSTLSSLDIEGFVGGYMPNIEGVGRHLLAKPFYKQIPFDVAAQVNSLTSADRAQDVAASLINVIRQAVYEGMAKTAYQAALDSITGGTEKPTVVIATDPVIARHMIVPGDTRLMSIGYDVKVVSSMDSRMRGKIFVSLVRPNVAEPNGLSFGCFAWMPELVSTVIVTRNGQVSKEPMVQPRTRHINTLPFLIRVDVSNLAEAVTDKVAVDTNQV